MEAHADIPNTLEVEEEEAQVPNEAALKDPVQKEGRKGGREEKYFLS